jgi:hypothetical protein
MGTRNVTPTHLRVQPKKAEIVCRLLVTLTLYFRFYFSHWHFSARITHDTVCTAP